MDNGMNNLQFIKHLINTSGFTKFPPVEVEDQFVPSTDDHIEREKETGSFLKNYVKILHFMK